jgi:Na+/H+ antiporter NhaC
MNRIVLVVLMLFGLSFAKAQSSDIEISSPDAYVMLGTDAIFEVQGDVIPDSILINDIYVQIDKGSNEILIENYQKDANFEPYVTFRKPKGEIPLWMSILPPVFAIILALAFKEVTYSLFTGIYIGCAVIGIYAEGWVGIFTGFIRVLDTYILDSLKDSGHLSVILFSLLIGALVAVISKNGGMAGVVKRITKYATTRRSGQLATYFLGIAIFFDDYANTLVVGNTMKSVTDKLKISREKLAYIVDSTAAPIAAIAFVTTWIGAELGYISDGLAKINPVGEEPVISEGVYSIFMSSLSYSFYPIFTLFFMFFIIWKRKDFGPMREYEQAAIEGRSEEDDTPIDEEVEAELRALEPEEGIKKRSFNAIIPILVVVFGTILGLVVTGFDSTIDSINSLQLPGMQESFNISTWGEAWTNMQYLSEKPETFMQHIGTLIGKADSYQALLWSSIAGLFAALFLSLTQKTLTVGKSMSVVISGFKTMLPAVIILVLAWALAGITEDLHTADFIKGLFGDTFSPVWIPAITFILSAAIAFSTGSSWSTMALIYPIMLPAAWAVTQGADYAVAESMNIFYITVSSVLAGAVLGDHCSPISDTTILSSLATSCNHVNHVRTQLPYAATVGAVALVFGIIPAAMGVSSLITIPIGVIMLYLIVHFFGKRVKGDV